MAVACGGWSPSAHRLAHHSLGLNRKFRPDVDGIVGAVTPVNSAVLLSGGSQGAGSERMSLPFDAAAVPFLALEVQEPVSDCNTRQGSSPFWGPLAWHLQWF